MKKTTLLVLSLLTLLWACKPAPEEASKYSDSLLAFQKPAFGATISLEKSLSDTLYENVLAKKDALQKTLHDNINSIKAQPDFDKSTKYRTAVLNYLLEINSLTENEYQEILNFMLKPTADFTEKDTKRYEKLKKLVVEKHQIALRHLQAAQEEFASSYEITIAQ